MLRLECVDPGALAGGETELTAPNGTRVRLVAAESPIALPPLRPSFVLTRNDSDASWTVGRAGMRYRDLVPDRQGGRFIASHIHIPGGGKVPDYVHFHRIRFQLIYCYKGWVRVAYQDQGPPFVLESGDCVLQPPGIRHRVLESSPDLEVIEVGSPAEHETHADPELSLPTPTVNPERDFGGQRFVRHQAAAATWGPWRCAGFEARDTGIAAATNGLGGVQVVRVSGATAASPRTHAGEFLFFFVLHGLLGLACDGRVETLRAGDCCVIPAGMEYALEGASPGMELLEVSLPAA